MHTRRLVRWCATVAAAAAVVAGGASPVSAVNGDADGAAHPYAGVLITLNADGSMRQGCSGVLVSPTAFLTAAHCAERFTADVPHAPRYVTFDPSWSTEDPSDLPDRMYLVDRGVVPPGWGTGRQSDDAVGDIGVAVLADPVLSIEPASIPDVGLLDRMMRAGTLGGSISTVVGYGSQGWVFGSGGQQPVSSAPLAVRRAAQQRIDAISPTDVTLMTIEQLGYGGNCVGDSGSPHLLGDVVVALSSMIDAYCTALSRAPRLDRTEVQDFLAPYLG